jgi:hypothetical protein
VLRLDELLRARDEALDRYALEVRALTDARDGVIAERDRARAALAQLDDLIARERAAHAAERDRLVRQIEAQERVVNYRASIRWWLLLPLVRARRVWTRIRAA